MPLPTLPTLKTPQLDIGGGDFGGIGDFGGGDFGGGFVSNPPNVQTGVSFPSGLNVGIVLPTGGINGGQPTGGTGSGGQSVPVAANASWLSVLTGAAGNQLLRFVLLIIGLICIIGAIYLFKSTNFLVSVPLKAGKETAKGALAAIKAGAAVGDAAGG